MSFNSERYGFLLSTTLPAVIETKEEFERLDKILGELLAKGEGISPEEDKLVDLISQLIEDYEDEIYSIEKGEPHKILRFLIDENGLKQKDLLPIFGSEGIVSEILRNKRGITARHAKMLGEFFKVSPELFI